MGKRRSVLNTGGGRYDLRSELGKSQSFNENPNYCGWSLDEVAGLVRRGGIRTKEPLCHTTYVSGTLSYD